MHTLGCRYRNAPQYSVIRKLHHFKRICPYRTNVGKVWMQEVLPCLLLKAWEERSSRLRLKCDGTRAETRFRLSGGNGRVHLNRRGRHFSRLLAAEIVMLDKPCSEVVWRVLATHSIRQFSLHFSSCASPCAITFQLDSTYQLHRLLV